MKYIQNLEKFLFLFLKIQVLEKLKLIQMLILKNFIYQEKIKNNFFLIQFLKKIM